MRSKSNLGGTALPNQLAALEQRLGPIEYRPIGGLKAYQNNPRKHPEKQLVKLMASIEEFGFAFPILIDEEGTIIVGEARVTAAKRLGIIEVPVIVAHHWSASQVKAYRLADNRLSELSTWDNEALAIELSALIELDETPIELLGWETGEIDVILDGDAPSTDPDDEQVEPPSEPISASGDLWVLDRHRLLCGSSLEQENWERLLEGETAAMAFSDAPFNVSISGHVSGLGKKTHDEFAMGSGEMSRPEFIDFLTQAFAQMARPLKDGGILTLAMDWRHSIEILSAMEANGLTLLNMCVWDKGSGGMGSLYRSQHELFWIGKKGKAPHTNNVQLGKHGRYRTNVWAYPGVNSFGKSRMADLEAHPTVKPVALVADAIRDVTKPGEIVLDAFMGSGTTILAAERTKRRGYGIEIEPRYVDVAIRRWEAMAGTNAVLAETGETFEQVATRREAEAAAALPSMTAGGAAPEAVPANA